MKQPYVAGPVSDYEEMNRKLTPEENQAEYAYWAAWLEKKREAAKVSTSGMQALRLELPKPPGGQDE